MENQIETKTYEDEKLCFNILFHVSASFAALIDEFEEPLRTTICVYYLILRGLDTVEDDTTIDKTIRLDALTNFPSFLENLKSNWKSIGFGHGLKLSLSESNKHHIEVMEKFDIILKVFGQCTTQHKKIIRDTVDEMAKGMIKYISQPIETMADYDEYCYYVSGIVGVGLTKIFESKSLLHNVHSKDVEKLAISTGQFLQKANIIRDIYEDMIQPQERIFYPKVGWGKYVNNLSDLSDEKCLPQAIVCLNFLINDAFQHLPDSIEYASLMSHKTSFRFCAILQAVAVGNLEKMYSNPAVFSSIVSMEKTEKVYIFENVTEMTSFLKVVKYYLSKLSEQVPSPNSFDGTKNRILESFKFVNEYKH